MRKEGAPVPLLGPGAPDELSGISWQKGSKRCGSSQLVGSAAHAQGDCHRLGGDADPPGLGEVRFRFAPNGLERRIPPPSWCEGPKGRLIDGVVRGRIRFSGEGGYTQVAVNRAKATVEAWPRMRCRYLEPGRSPRKWTAAFEAFREAAPNAGFSFELYPRRLRPRSKQVVFEAHTPTARGRVWILRTVTVAADVSSFVLLDPETAPENFTVTPPPPFSGTATFQRTPESVFTWEGDLSVQFPGAEPLSLAGPGFHTTYCALRGCINQSFSPSGQTDSVVAEVGLSSRRGRPNAERSRQIRKISRGIR